MLVGGYAVGMYGHVRATTDIDFFYRCTSENVQRLMRAMTMFGAPAGLIDAQHLATRDAVTQLGAPPIRIDLLSSISGVTFEEAVPGSLVLAVHERFTAPQTFVLRPNEMRETASTVVNSTRHDRLFPAASLSETRYFSGTQFGTVLPAFFFVPIFSYPSQHGSADFFDPFFFAAVFFFGLDFFAAAFFFAGTVVSRNRITEQGGRSIWRKHPDAQRVYIHPRLICCPVAASASWSASNPYSCTSCNV